MKLIKTAKKYGISDFQLYALLVCTILGAGITTLPRTTAQYAGRDAWISIIIGGVIIWLITCLIYLLCKRFPDKTLPEFSIQVLGKPIGTIISIGYIVYALFLGSSAFRIYTELVKTWVMIWTPHWVFIVVFLSVVVYTARMGVITLGRLMELVVLMTLPAFLLFIPQLSEFDKLNLLPIGNTGLSAIMAAVPEAGFAYLGFEILLIFFPLMANRKNIFRVFTLALATVTIVYATNIVLTVGVLSAEQTIVQIWPLINYLRIGTLPVFERLDTILLIVWSIQIFGVVVIQYFVATFSTAVLIGKRAHDFLVLIFLPIIFGLTIFPQRVVEVFTLSDFVGRWGTIYVVTTVFIIFLVSIIRGQDDRKAGKEK